MSQNKDILDDAVTQVWSLVKNYNISDEDKVSIERVIDEHRARVEQNNSDDACCEAERFYLYIRMSSEEVARRMSLNEKELWTPYTV